MDTETHNPCIRGIDQHFAPLGLCKDRSWVTVLQWPMMDLTLDCPTSNGVIAYVAEIEITCSFRALEVSDCYD